MGEHRTTVRSRRAAGSVVAAGAAPLIATLIGAGTAHADVVPTPFTAPAVSFVLPALPPMPALPAGPLPPAPDPAAPIEEAPPGTLRFGDLEMTLPFDTRSLDAGADRAQEQLTAFLDSSGIERGRADRVAAQAMSSGLIGAGIGAAAAAPVAIPFAMLGAVAGFVVGLPFLPTGLVVGPALGATIAYGVVTVPAMIAGAALGAAFGATDGFTVQPFGPLPPL